MNDYCIVSVEHIQRRAHEAFENGQQAEDCPFPWHSSAHKTWIKEFKRLSNGSVAEEARAA